ncbi:DUF5696 domain-containing protein [Paenibacillus fonticola]|uniref:DUF5696 domain-containing protein n=1 Tax=Paenibacillus fonticola TaxID=379896 RepID=UPI000371BF7E|nr:DUF5696 domain-containing protein [Paenibacillus fonticola]
MRTARFKQLLLLKLAALLLISGCSGYNSVGQEDEGVQLETAFAEGKALNASFMDFRLTGMKGVAENELLRLFIDEASGEIAVLHKPTGDIWYSNPPDREADSIAAGVNKDLLSAQLKLDYYNSFGQLNSINTFSDSVAHRQMNIEAIPNGLRVTYQFGTAQKSAADLPLMLSKSRIEELASKLDKTGQRALTIAYTFDDEKSAYVRNDNALNGLQLDRAFKAFEDAGYTEEQLQQDMEELQFTQEKPVARIFRAAIEYMLDADSLVVKVPVSSIQYPKAYPVGNISVISFFGAGGSKEEGSIFVPDGSGALIHYNNGKIKYPPYQQSVYGADMAMEVVENAVKEQTVRLPVFGMIREGSAFLGIIEEGAAEAVINADVSGRLNSYNYVYPTFTVLNKGQVTLQANGQERTLPKFQEKPMQSDFTIRYAFLHGNEASYQGMARYYQQYLERSGGLPERRKENTPASMPFYLQLVGGISKRKHFAGIPYTTVESLTTLEHARSLIQDMEERDIANIKLKYTGWFNGGMDHQVPAHVKVDSAVGGSKEFGDFIMFTKEQGISFYPDVAFLTAHSGKGFDEADEASRTLQGVPARFYPLDMALNRRDRNKTPSYAVSPRLIDRYSATMLEELQSYGADGISLRDLADQLNSDFRKNRQIDRTESEELSVQALSGIRNGALQILADGGNAYALPYVSDITNAPLFSSQFKLEDEEIPFYQMVIRGYIDYTGAPYNLSTYTNVQRYLLKCLEYGAGVYFEWIYEPNYKVKDTEHNNLYSVNYDLWMDQAAEIYYTVNHVLRGVQNERIIGHEKLAEGVFKTVYENGTFVIVNYNRTQVTIDGKTIKAESYMIGGEQVE